VATAPACRRCQQPLEAAYSGTWVQHVVVVTFGKVVSLRRAASPLQDRMPYIYSQPLACNWAMEPCSVVLSSDGVALGAVVVIGPLVIDAALAYCFPMVVVSCSGPVMYT
jgi:hypothetical protein